MMIIQFKFSKRHYVRVRQITTYLLVCCLFLSMLPSVAMPGPKGKALGHINLHGNGIGRGGVEINGIATGNTFNPSGAGAFGPTNGRVNPAGIIVGSGGVKINGIATGLKPGNGNTFNPSSTGAFSPANIIPANSGVNPPGNNVFFTPPGSNIVVILNSQGNHIPVNKVKMAGGQKLVLAAGDAFSMAIPTIGSLSASLTVPDPIDAKGPNPTHGGSHPNKGDGNPGGGNGNGHWGR